MKEATGSVHNGYAEEVDRCLFVGSEDFEAIEAAEQWATSHNWTVFHNELFDRR
jgi:hypothetical protein